MKEKRGGILVGGDFLVEWKRDLGVVGILGSRSRNGRDREGEGRP